MSKADPKHIAERARRELERAQASIFHQARRGGKKGVPIDIAGLAAFVATQFPQPLEKAPVLLQQLYFGMRRVDWAANIKAMRKQLSTMLGRAVSKDDCDFDALDRAIACEIMSADKGGGVGATLGPHGWRLSPRRIRDLAAKYLCLKKHQAGEGSGRTFRAIEEFDLDPDRDSAPTHAGAAEEVVQTEVADRVRKKLSRLQEGERSRDRKAVLANLIPYFFEEWTIARLARETRRDASNLRKAVKEVEVMLRRDPDLRKLTENE